jgi:hypothetical protein
MLGHTGYYRKFIKGYAQITTPMEKLLKKENKFQWSEECQEGLDTLKQEIGYRVDFDISILEEGVSCSCGCVICSFRHSVSSPGEGDIDHPIAFARRKLSTTEHNYTTTEREGLAMVYALQKFRHYLLGSHFKMYTNHYVLRYLVNKPVLGGRICRWILLFQEYDFEVIVKPGKFNSGPDHLSCILSGEDAGNLDDNLPDMCTYLQYKWLMTILQT